MQVSVLPISLISIISCCSRRLCFCARYPHANSSALCGQTVCLAEGVAKAMSRTFPGISTDLQKPSSYRFPMFQGSLRNALATSRRPIARNGSDGVHRETMSDHEIRAFIARMQLLKQEEETVARRYFSAYGGLITQMQADEGSLS
jgi:hypothetical protein